jgi:hypothetical protein
MNKRSKKGFMYIAIGVVDVSIWMLLGVLLMGYDDFYDESKGDYRCFSSMTTPEKIISILWGFWFWLHIALIIFSLGNFLRKKSQNKCANLSNPSH